MNGNVFSLSAILVLKATQMLQVFAVSLPFSTAHVVCEILLDKIRNPSIRCVYLRQK